MEIRVYNSYPPEWKDEKRSNYIDRNQLLRTVERIKTENEGCRIDTPNPHHVTYLLETGIVGIYREGEADGRFLEITVESRTPSGLKTITTELELPLGHAPL